jgi:erythrin-vacuolar iron transport family protein
VMTALGGIFHTLPFLIANFKAALAVAVVVVLAELATISWVRHRFMESPWLSTTVQVVIGGILVFVAGVIIGSS